MTDSSDRRLPKEITVRAYQVGFGDCFLLGFHYARFDNRYILIDFGSTENPRALRPDPR